VPEFERHRDAFAVPAAVAGRDPLGGAAR
jgi:hypothetical protein